MQRGGCSCSQPRAPGHPEGLIVTTLFTKVQLLGQESRETGCGETATGLGAVPAPGVVPGLVHLLSPRSQSALPIPAVPTPLTAGCPPAAHPCCAQRGLAPGDGLGAGPGLPVAVPGRCSDCVSSLSPCAARDDSALPPSARSPSGTWGCDGTEGLVLGWGGCQHPLLPESCLEGHLGIVSPPRLLRWLPPRAAPWGLSPHDPSHRSSCDWLPALLLSRSELSSCPECGVHPPQVPQAAPFCGSSAWTAPSVLGDTTQAAPLGWSSCPSVTQCVPGHVARSCPCRAAAPSSGSTWCARGLLRFVVGGGLPQFHGMPLLWDLVPGIRCGAFLGIRVGRPSSFWCSAHAAGSPGGGQGTHPARGAPARQLRVRVPCCSDRCFLVAGQPWPLPTKGSRCRRR